MKFHRLGSLCSGSGAVLWLLSENTMANWDPATGHIYDFGPSQSWINQNKDEMRCFNEIQVAECAQNTRLSYPHVQAFASFQVDHSKDHNHGCPYGTCCAFTALPSPSDMQADFTNRHSFFWHNLGGLPGPGTNPIANPQTGGFGYESSDGKFHDGPADLSQEQPGHDSHYPGLHLPPAWPKIQYPNPNGPKQPKCGLPNAPNSDPGQVSGSYGSYTPAPASSYSAPATSSLGWRFKLIFSWPDYLLGKYSPALPCTVSFSYMFSLAGPACCLPVTLL